MLWVKLHLTDTFPQSNKFVIGVKIKVTQNFITALHAYKVEKQWVEIAQIHVDKSYNLFKSQTSNLKG